jgi:hypothetical protein
MLTTGKQESVKIFSWNVLHIIHEWNFVGEDSLVIRKYGDESARLELILAFIKNIYDTNTSCIINLQEVPGDLLDKLIVLFNSNIYYHTYDRLPKLKKEGDIYLNKTESLVSIVKNVHYISSNFVSLGTGKGYLHLNVYAFSVYLNILNVHMPFKYSNVLNLELENLFICGDFNCSSSESCIIFDKCNSIPNDKYTFISWRDMSVKTDILDHVLTKSSDLIDLSKPLIIHECDYSDHMPISCDLAIWNHF